MILFERLADQPRTSAYLKALESVVRPGMRIMEVGKSAGPFSLAALKMGAESATVVVESGYESVVTGLARDNGLCDRIQVLTGRIELLQLDHEIDLLLGDPRAHLPDYGGEVQDLIAARSRFLKSDGVAVPRRDTLWLAPLSWKEAPSELAVRLQHQTGLNLSELSRFRFNQPSPIYCTDRSRLGEPRPAGSVDYLAYEASLPDFSGTWKDGVPSPVHGFLAWFESELLDDIVITSMDTTSYRPVFFPFGMPVAWTAGEELHFALKATPTIEMCAWSWVGGVGTGRDQHCNLFSCPTKVRRVLPRSGQEYS